MINNSNYDVDILINDEKPIRQYAHENKIYIEARDGVEYSIKIKNNSCARILAIVSVDGLSVLTGKPATSEDGGYIINGLDNYRIKGFRYDNDKVGAFKFVPKNESYAAEKGKKAKRNCGVIGIILYSEKVNYSITSTWPNNWPWYNTWPTYPTYPTWPIDFPGTLYRSINSGTSGYASNNDGKSGYASNNNSTLSFNSSLGDTAPLSSKGAGGSSAGGQSVNSFNMSSDVESNVEYTATKGISNYSSQIKEQPQGFDMGSGWGNSVESKVVTTTFERGSIIYNADLYYASREALINMGVPVKKNGSVSYPKSFNDGYAKPPHNWKG